MIEHARGNAAFRIGAANWTPDGPVRITGASGSVALDFDLVRRSLQNDDPVIIQGVSETLGPYGQHFVLAVAIRPDGKIVALDPYGGREIEIDPVSGVASGSLAGTFTANAMRMIDMSARS